MAGLVIPTVGDNRLRHEALQRFMLANDSTTLAVEVPIWLASETIRELEREHVQERSPHHGECEELESPCQSHCSAESPGRRR